jgi:two-component system, cell cycle response regulator
VATPKIIVVEDDENVSALLIRQLRRAGYSVEHASTMAGARELFRRNGCEVVILDRGLPDGDGIDLCRELRVSSPHCYIMLVTGCASDEAKLQGFEVGADDYVTKPFQIDELVARIRAGVRIVQLQKALIDTNRRLEELSLTDSLTRVANRRAFDERIAAGFEHARRYERALSLVLVDIDRFKTINDKYGHDAGDHVLRAVADAIADNSRHSDFVARIGGEEFAILLPETPLFEAMQFGEKLRCSIAVAPNTPERVTISIGIANMPHSLIKNAADLFHAADQALYRAKANGRNRVEIERRREIREPRVRWQSETIGEKSAS